MGQLKRFEDWPERLASFITASQARPFAWGSWDCCLFAADVVVEITGTDLAADLRGTYNDESTGFAVFNRHGGAENILRTRIGEPLPNVALAQRGDVALFKGIDGIVSVHPSGMMGVVIGGDVAILTPDRMATVPLLRCSMAWRV